MTTLALAVLMVAQTDQPSFIGQTVFKRLIAESRSEHWDRLPIGERMKHIGLELLDTPYVGWTLERDPDREFPFCTLEGLDCVTFFESTFNLARILPRKDPKPEDLVEAIRQTRYRGSKVDGYLSRLHYTSEWMADNVRKGFVTDLTKSLPGNEPFDKPIDFMTRHREVYVQLKKHPELMPAIGEMERRVTSMPKRYIPKERIAGIEDRLRSGDIVGITTDTPGMDCSHTGLIMVLEGRARFVHASSVDMKVIIGPTISEYVAGRKGATGVMFVRPR